MNETSRGVGDPPIGGFANPSSSTSLRLNSASHAGITSATISSSSIPGDIGGITITHDPRHTDPTLPSLGASLGSEFDAFGADNLNLTKLLGSDSVGSPWGDPFADPSGPNAGTSGSSSNQREYPIRPWELDLASVPASTAPQTTITHSGPPNVLAPPSDTTLPPGLPRPPHHAPTAAQYFPPPIGQPTYIDQRLPSFQSQFQATADAATAAAFHASAPHYSALVSPHHAAAAGAIPPHAMQHVSPAGAAANHQFLDHHQQALHAGYHHPASAAPGHPHSYPLHPRPHFPPTTGSHSRLHSHLTQPLHHPQHQQQQQQHLASPQRIVARKSVVDNVGVQSADTTKLPLSRPSSAASSLSGGNTDLMSSPAQQTPTTISATEAAHPTLAAQLRKKTGRAGSMEGSDVSGSTDHTSDAPGQVSAISSTDGVAFKPPGATGSATIPHGAPARTSMGRGKASNQRKQALMMESHSSGGPGRIAGGATNGGSGVAGSAVPTPSMDPDKPVKKKRKRCGECTGCQRKDNCGECAPCRNDKSHQICKQRRCERLTEKKPKPGGVGRGQGKKSAGNGEYKPRGRGAGSASNSTNNNNSLTTPGQTTTPTPLTKNDNSSTITKMDTSPIPPGNRNLNTQTGAPASNNNGALSGNNNNPGNTSSLLQPTQFGGSSYSGGASVPSSSSSNLPSWGGAPPTQTSHQWQQQNTHYQPPSQYGQSQQFGVGSNFAPNSQFGAPTSNAGSGFLTSPNMNTASTAVGSSPGGSAFVGLNGNNQVGGGSHHYSLNVNTGPMHTDPKTGYPMASPLGGAGSIHASPRAGGPLLPTAIGGTTHLQTAMSGNSMPGYPHRPAGASSHNSSQLRSPITSEGYSGDKNRTGISPDTTTKDDQQHQIRNLQHGSQNNPYQQNQNVHHMPQTPHHYNNINQPMRSPQQPVHSSGMGHPQGAGNIPPQQRENIPASFLAYSAGDVASMAQNRNQDANYSNRNTNTSTNNSSNQSSGANLYAGYNSNMALLNAASGVSSKMSSSVSGASGNAMNQQRYTGGDISRINDSKNDAMKNYSALDRTASALPNNMNYQQMTARNNAQSSLQDNISRFSPQSMSASNTSSSSSTNPSSYPTQRSNMPIPNYSTSSSNNSNQQQQYQQQMSYQQQRQLSTSLSEQQHMQQKPQIQTTNISQGQNSKLLPTNVGQSTLPATSTAMMSPNQIQPVLKSHPIPSERSQIQSIHQPNQNEVETSASVQQQQGIVGKTNSLPQSLHGDYPKNLPMLALQQQKINSQVPPPTYHGNIPNVNSQSLTAPPPPVSPQKQRHIRPFNTPKSPNKTGQYPPRGNLSLPGTYTVNKDATTFIKPELEDTSKCFNTTKNANLIQEPEVLKVPTTPTKKKQSQPKTPVKSFLNSNRRDRFASSEESSPLKRIRDGTTSNYAADHEAEMERLGTRYKDEAPSCDCMNSSQQALAPDTGPYYVHLGHAKTIADLRTLFEGRTGVHGDALRIEKIKYVPREGKTVHGCPVAKYIVRRRDEQEKFLVACKHRLGHRCEYTWTVTLIIAWEGLSRKLADNAYDIFKDKLGNYGLETRRQCDSNSDQTCACQGGDEKTSGASYTYGCSWSMYFNSCKFAKSSGNVRKFRLEDEAEEEELEDQSHLLATNISPLFKRLAPQAFGNMTAYESLGSDCRIGLKRGRPFSGITTVADFCAHAHKDRNNMNGGTTVIVTLTKPENRDNWRNPDDEQLHVLPHYMPDKTDEFGSQEGQKYKVQRGDVNILDRFHRTIARRRTRNLKCVKRKNQKQLWRSGPKSGNPQGDRKRFLDQYAKAARLQKIGSPIKLSGTDLGIGGSNNDVSSSPLARPLPKDSPKSSLPQIDGNLSPTYSSDGDSEYEPPNNTNEIIGQVDGVADYYSPQHPTSGMPMGQQQYYPGMGQSPQGGMGMNSYGGPPSQQYNPSGQYSGYGNQNMQQALNGNFNTSSPRSEMGINNSYPTSSPQMQMNSPGVNQQQQYQRQSGAGMQMIHGSNPYQPPQQQFQLNGGSSYPSRAPNIPSNVYTPQQQGYSVATPQMQQIPNMPQYQGTSALMNGITPMSSSGSPSMQSASPSMPQSTPYGYRQGQYMPIPDNYNRTGTHPNPNQHLQNTPAQQSMSFNANNPSTPLVPQEVPNLPAPFGSVSDFKRRMISIRNEISEEDTVPKEDVKAKNFLPENSASDSDEAGSPFKTPARRARTTSAPLKETAKPEVKEEKDPYITAPDIQYEESDCPEVFGEHNRHIGGLAISLPHGSLVIECAKAEVHATTALKHPNRYNPTRIGMVFYQHKSLNYPHHGQGNSVHTTRQKNERDYQAWKDGLFVPTQRKLQTMIEQGFKFPDHVATIDAGTKLKFEDIQKPDLSFLRGDDGIPPPLELSFADEHERQKQAMPSPPTPDALSPQSQLSPVVEAAKSPAFQPELNHIESDVKQEIKEEVTANSVEQQFGELKEELLDPNKQHTNVDSNHDKDAGDIKLEEIKKEEIKTEEIKTEENSNTETTNTA